MPMRTTKLLEMKQAGERIPCVTAYDYPTALLAEEAGIPVILVGDSLGNVVLGYETTVPVTMDDMVHHTKAVMRAAPGSLVIADMPFMSYNASSDEALRNAGRLLQEGGAQAVKLEGGLTIADTVRRITESGIPVMGHLGLTPQSVNQLGGYRVQGRTLPEAQRMLDAAEALQAAGAFAVVLETIPNQLAEVVTKRLTIPTIGIGAGGGCDGQIQVIHDILGLTQRRPKHAKLYADLNAVIGQALRGYAEEVRTGAFPADEHAVQIDDAVLRELRGIIEGGGELDC
jgi:3-methyl-2-oxobutanoate hydroxymethyltransferase